MKSLTENAVAGYRRDGFHFPLDILSPEETASYRRRLEASLTRARTAGFLYGVTGSVEEWRYRSGIDGEPAIGLTVEVIDIATGKVLWSGTGSRAGWGREVLTGTAQKLLSSILQEMEM